MARGLRHATDRLTAVTVACAAAVYAMWLGSRVLTWGRPGSEVARPYPGNGCSRSGRRGPRWPRRSGPLRSAPWPFPASGWTDSGPSVCDAPPEGNAAGRPVTEPRRPAREHATLRLHPCGAHAFRHESARLATPGVVHRTPDEHARIAELYVNPVARARWYPATSASGRCDRASHHAVLLPFGPLVMEPGFLVIFRVPLYRNEDDIFLPAGCFDMSGYPLTTPPPALPISSRAPRRASAATPCLR